MEKNITNKNMGNNMNGFFEREWDEKTMLFFPHITKDSFNRYKEVYLALKNGRQFCLGKHRQPSETFNTKEK